ncbi:MAG: G1 family glutamic endopeptidase [Candidatus Sulfotelmatobacter sp.]
MISTWLNVSGMLLLAASVPALAQRPSEAISSSRAVTITPRQHRPRFVAPGTRPPFLDPIRNVTVSYNTIWAGYAVTGSDFSLVQGSWIVTAVDCTKTPNSDSSEWVGIDGWSSNTVEQIGTDADCNGKTPFYYVWYEFFPLNTVVISDVSIAPGNKFSAMVNYAGDSEYVVSITNDTTGESFSKKVQFKGADGSGAPKRNSAEWIEEMDGNELSDFGIDPFGEFYTGVSAGTDSATDSTNSGPINDFGSAVQESISTKNGTSGSKDTAVPSALASDGASFKVAWKSE